MKSFAVAILFLLSQVVHAEFGLDTRGPKRRFLLDESSMSAPGMSIQNDSKSFKTKKSKAGKNGKKSPLIVDDPSSPSPVTKGSESSTSADTTKEGAKKMKGSVGSIGSAKSKQTSKSKEVTKAKSQSGKKSQKGLQFIKMVRSSLPEPWEAEGEAKSSEAFNTLNSATADNNSASVYSITAAMTFVVGGALMAA